MPVMNSAMVMDSGSASNATSMCSAPTGIHENSVITSCRSSELRESRSKYTLTVTRNEAIGIAAANQPERGSPRRRPNTINTSAPINGNAGNNHSALVMISPSIP